MQNPAAGADTIPDSATPIPSPGLLLAAQLFSEVSVVLLHGPCRIGHTTVAFATSSSPSVVLHHLTMAGPRKLSVLTGNFLGVSSSKTRYGRRKRVQGMNQSTRAKSIHPSHSAWEHGGCIIASWSILGPFYQEMVHLWMETAKPWP